ncbi:hypothetical protein E2C06_33660 [Dankookia rubra]|uniref:Uncharacterized protein n=1 Tax=Dankookia rubra TaxID=1442381 RepID=A0A4R5Q809_9PROT|nr:hypothetical protein [Dankookia rubra]TDH58237.1 hypothetical protein E2C06_33660 [Dankookia rubra]
MTTAISHRTWHLHGIIDGIPTTGYRGAPEAHAECQRLAAALLDARRAFRHATLAGEFGAAISAELAWCTSAAELRRELASLRRPKLQPFSTEEIDTAVLGLRRYADAMFDYEPEDELEEDEPDEEE